MDFSCNCDQVPALVRILIAIDFPEYLFSLRKEDDRLLSQPCCCTSYFSL